MPFYSRLGFAALGTVMDGDCGIDTMCAMLRRPQTIDARTTIRLELHDFLMKRTNEPWMQDILLARQEITRRNWTRTAVAVRFVQGVFSQCSHAEVERLRNGRCKNRKRSMEK